MSSSARQFTDEVLSEAMAEILRAKTPAERLSMALRSWTFLRDLIRRKQKGEKLVTAEPVEDDNVIDLMEALKKSLKSKGARKAS